MTKWAKRSRETFLAGVQASVTGQYTLNVARYSSACQAQYGDGLLASLALLYVSKGAYAKSSLTREMNVRTMLCRRWPGHTSTTAAMGFARIVSCCRRMCNSGYLMRTLHTCIFTHDSSLGICHQAGWPGTSDLQRQPQHPVFQYIP